ncbi:MAG TPA: MerR family transcriptional regulator [Candidatus Dormibacteraeota bacterium]|jgi:effector-binding domain-containing protein|nr:MerR family transcriptional regulator [Candidatus Dormibacteraeota bacterium]
MPLEEIRVVLAAPDTAARNAGIAAHPRHMERHLEQTRATVASLRRLLEEPPPTIAVEYRSIPPAHVFGLRSRVAMDDVGQWWGAAFDQLHEALTIAGLQRSGPDSALYPAEFFQAGLGEVTAFIPVTGGPGPSRQPGVLELPGAELAVAVHRGAFDDLDTTYGALGGFVTERAIGVDGPIRENYMVSAYDTADEARHQTEVCWPEFLTAPAASR